MKTRNFILIGLTILLWFSFRFLLPLTLPFVLAYFFAKLVSPMIQFLVNKLKWRRKVSIFLVVFFTLLILGGFSANYKSGNAAAAENTGLWADLRKNA